MEAHLKSRIEKEVKKNLPSSISFLKDIINLKSYSGREGNINKESVVKRVYEKAKKIKNVKVHTQYVGKNQNIISVLKGKEEGKTVIFVAHTDTVDAGIRKNWYKCDPFSGLEGYVHYKGNRTISLEIEEETYNNIKIREQMADIWEKRIEKSREIIYGRGSYDNKSSVAISLLALETLSNFDISGNVIAANTVSEETNAAGAKKFAEWLVEREYIKNTYAIVMEGSYAFNPLIGHKGIGWYTIKTKGKASHAATPELGVNAVEKMSHILHYMYKYREELLNSLYKIMDDNILGKPTFVPGTTIAGGGIKKVESNKVYKDNINVIPDWCEATIDVRLVRGKRYPEDTEKVLKSIKNVFKDFINEKAKPSNWSFDVELDRNTLCSPCAIGKNLEDAKNNFLVKKALSIAEDVQVIKLDIGIALGATEATFLANKGIQTLVEYGPAGALSHEPHEFVEKKQIEEGAEILSLLALNLLGGEINE